MGSWGSGLRRGASQYYAANPPVDLALFDSWGLPVCCFDDFLRVRTRTKSFTVLGEVATRHFSVSIWAISRYVGHARAIRR